ncbi:MAG: ROK family transcriptional regulator [Pyrinomonadaceae bacterium]
MKRINLQRAKAQIARPNTIRDINRRIVLNYVRDQSPISRSEIARRTALHRSTVSVITDDLVSAGLIVEFGEGSSSGGRKPTLFKLKSGTPVAIGVDVTPRTTTVAIADLAGRIMEQDSFPTSPDMELMTTRIMDRVKRLAKKYDGHDLEVGVSVPGLVDQKLGLIFHIPYFDWRDWDLCQRIEEETQLHVIVENDANTNALAELWFGHEKIRRVDTFVSVLVGEGIGTGIILDGQVYRGEKGAGGEFGHMIVGEDAPIDCSCGSRECWEAYASEKAMISRYQNLVNGKSPNGDTIEFGTLIKLAVNGDEHAVTALQETAYFLGNGISNLIVGLSPQVVVVSGKITQAWNLFADQLDRVSERSVLAGLPPTELMPSSLGDTPTLIGAVGLVLARKFGSV